MMFRIDGRFFEQGAARTIDLLAFLRAAAARAHSVMIVEDVLGSTTQEAVLFTEWQGSLSAILQREVSVLADVVRRISPNAVARGSKSIAVPFRRADLEVTDPSHMVLTLPAATRLAGLPLFVMVENGLSEAAFLRQAMPAYWQAKLLEWVESGYMHFENAGGNGEMQRIIENFASGQSIDPLGLGAAAWRSAHVFLCDRDSNVMDGRPSLATSKLIKACKKAGLLERLHVLKRRGQESYLPREALTAIVLEKTKTNPEQRTQMLELIANHFATEHTRNHEPLPAPGQSPWFKNAFLSAGIRWKPEWFERDGSDAEMTEIAELIAACV
jgi:hypothetical protein